jgi:methylenetetrahydrofolate dehydrogenase (NADP+)/methenyltetrahydrofolate cyclohydrolase
MKSLVINANSMKEKKIEELKNRVKKATDLGERVPKLVILNASDCLASKSYIRNKTKVANEVNINAEVIQYDNSVTTEALEKKIIELNNDTETSGMILQLPLYDHLDKDRLISLISSKKDADCFSNERLGKMLQGDSNILPCTPKGVLNLLEEHNVEISGKNICVLGRSTHVGLSLGLLLTKLGANVTCVHSKTTKEDLDRILKASDIVISCIGKYNFIKSEQLKNGAILLGVGIDFFNGKQRTDYDVEAIINSGVCKYVGDRINTTGTATVLALIENTVALFEEQVVVQ